MMLNFKVLKITGSKSADEIRKTRRNWNTGTKEGNEDMPGKSLFSRNADPGDVEISVACLAWNFDTRI